MSEKKCLFYGVSVPFNDGDEKIDAQIFVVMWSKLMKKVLNLYASSGGDSALMQSGERMPRHDVDKSFDCRGFIYCKVYIEERLVTENMRNDDFLKRYVL